MHLNYPPWLGKNCLSLFGKNWVYIPLVGESSTGNVTAGQNKCKTRQEKQVKGKARVYDQGKGKLMAQACTRIGNGME